MVIIQDIAPIILNLPVIVTIIAATRYIIGFKTWRNYTAVTLALAFYLIYETTRSFWVTLFVWASFVIAVIGGAILTRYAIRKRNINYYGRIAFIYLGGTVLLFALVPVLSWVTGIPLFSKTMIMIGAFLIGTTIDDLATLQFKKDSQEFLRRIVTTFVLGLVCGSILVWEWWNNVLVNHQEILIAVLLANILIATWSNIRITEILRFKSILKN
ncbi:MAG: 7TM domain-containing protein [Candidatus Dojkabacteria bacterium]|nr:MAG: 7TM domain-containing protein [Candidatus Dojkabacteria bacterium]